MDKLLVFVNFMKASERALEQAIELAKVHSSSIVMCHIPEPGSVEEETRTKLKPFLDMVEEAGIKGELMLEYGDLFDVAKATARKVNPDLVVAGTRGIEGFDMRLHGSAIYKFVRDIGYTSLIIHPESPIIKGGYKRVMLPVSPHGNFIKKVRETIKILAQDGEVIVFSLIRKGEELDAKVVKNKKDTEAILNERGIKWRYFDYETTLAGHNFATETLDRIKDQEMDVISIAADLSRENRHFGKMHKEDVLLNQRGIPVLCVNTDFE